jgi:hypothetical protein
MTMSLTTGLLASSLIAAAGCMAAETDSEMDDASVCSLSITQNTYDGPNYWGTMTVKNPSSSSVTGFRVDFDVPAGAHCTNDSVPSGAVLSPLTGSGTSAYTTSNHCTFTWSSATLAGGASKTFNYSTDTTSFSSATNATGTGLSCSGSGGGSCSFTVTQNSYDGPNYWGTMTYKNAGTTTATGLIVDFDVPLGAHCTNDSVPSGAVLSPLTGTGTSAHTTSNHCTFTWASASLAAGASKTFNYSTDTTAFSVASNVAVHASSCSGGGTGGTGTTINGVYVTWYGFNDNSCQIESEHNCNTIAFPKSGGFPTKHDIATEGTGTYSDPVTFATAANDDGSGAEIKVGSIIYVPEVRKYFVMEDSCYECGQEWAAQRSWHVDLWMGPSYGSDNTSLMNCEDKLTLGSAYHGSGTIIVNPPTTLTVDTHPLFSNDTCTAHTY